MTWLRVEMGDKTNRDYLQGSYFISNTHDYHQSYAPLYLIGVNVYCVQWLDAGKYCVFSQC